MPLIYTGIPKGHQQHEAWVEKGRPPLRKLPFGKAEKMVFPYMEMVKGNSRNHEEKIASWCKSRGYPVRLFDWNDEELAAAYFEAHPEEVPATIKDQARLMAKSYTQEGQAGITEDAEATKDAILSGDRSPMMVRGVKRGKDAREGRQTDIGTQDARFTAVHAEQFAKHKAAGKTDAAANNYATKSAKAAAKKA